MRTRRLALVVLLAVAAVAGLVSPSAAQTVQLFAQVGPDTTIVLRDAAGQQVRQLDPGAYRITVEDRSDFHNFHLTGPGGVNLATDVERIETLAWDVTLVEGVYTFVCDPHRSAMRGSFTVGDPPPPPAPKRLVATVTATAIALTLDGRRVSTLDAGAYVVTVRDRSRRHNFHLVGPGVNRKTTVARVGTFTWAVTLRPGAFRFVSDPQARRLRGSFRVR